MAAQLPTDMQDAFYRVVHDHGVEKLAGKMGLSPGVLYNKANPSDEHGNKPTLADGVVASVVSGDDRIAQAFCHTLGGIFVRLPDLSGLTTDALVLHLTEIGAEGGDFYRAIHEALELDDTISRSEFDLIEREALQFIAVIHEGLLRMREMAR